MGLLEKLLARLETLETRLAKLDPSVLTGDAATSVAATTTEAAVEAVKPESTPVGTATAQVESVENPAESVELAFDSTCKHKIPWDSRIHSSSKNTNAKGDWKKLRGVNDMTFKTIEAELVAAAQSVTPAAAQSVTPAAAQSCDTDTGEVTDTPTAPSVPVTPTPPAPVVPSTPSTPAVPTTPTPPVEDSPRAKVNKEISLLTQSFHVPHESIIEYALKPHGADTIDALAPDQLEPVAVELKGWADYLGMVYELADKYDDMHVKSPESGLDKVVTAFCQQYGAECVTPGMVPKPSVSLLYEAVKENCGQWEKHLASQGK